MGWLRGFGMTLLALWLLGCGPAVAGHEETCRVEGTQGECEGAYRSIRGRYLLEVAAPSIPVGEAVEVEVQVAVDGGALRAAVTSPSGEESACVARPDSPDRLTGIATVGDGERLPIMLEAVRGRRAVGVTYMVAWAATP
jgi:hypothetical protein